MTIALTARLSRNTPSAHPARSPSTHSTQKIRTMFMGQDVELISSSGCLDAQFDVPHPDTPWDCHRTAAPLTPKTTPGLIGSPMAVPWSVWDMNIKQTDRVHCAVHAPGHPALAAPSRASRRCASPAAAPPRPAPRPRACCRRGRLVDGRHHVTPGGRMRPAFRWWKVLKGPARAAKVCEFDELKCVVGLLGLQSFRRF